MSDNFDCMKCPGYCCGYPIIQATNNDIKRLAKHLGKTVDETRSSFTVLEKPTLRRLRMTHDSLLKTQTCVFLDKRTRSCTVYEGRPHICREHPGDRCEWHDRRLIEQAMATAQGKRRPVIMLKEMPWTVDADHPLYDGEDVTKLLQSYAGEGAGDDTKGDQP